MKEKSQVPDLMRSRIAPLWAVLSGRRSVVVSCLIFLFCWDSLFHSTRQGKLFSSFMTPLFISVASNYRTPVVDILSVGTLLKDDFHEAQRLTFGQHAAVRHFFPITERDDTDEACYTSLTTDQMKGVLEYCRKQHMGTNPFRHLFHPKGHIGWFCSQKRPLDGLFHVLQMYKSYSTNGTMDLPDYLILTELDTYLNMERLMSILRQLHPVRVPSAIAGCLKKVELDAGIAFPNIGFGAVFTRASLQRLLQPIYCNKNASRDSHSKRACWRLQRNALGEQALFSDGMSVADLMHKFTSSFLYTSIDSWNGTGYCLHSNHALAYFVNFYHILAVEDTILEDADGHPTEKALRHNSFVQLAGQDGSECSHEKQKCAPDHSICHGLSPAQIYALHQQTNVDVPR